MSGKSVLLFGCFLALIAVFADGVSYNHYNYNYGPNQRNNSDKLIVGHRLPGDGLVHSERIAKTWSFFRGITLLRTFNVTGYQRSITMVRAFDNDWKSGNAATVSLLKGGTGTNNVTLRFKSPRGQGINCTVEIYAR